MKPERIQTRLRNTPAWTPEQKPRSIVRSIEFTSFSEAAEFLTRIGQLGSAFDHYPVVSLEGKMMMLRLSTPGAGGLTELDFEIAEKIDQAL